MRAWMGIALVAAVVGTGVACGGGDGGNGPGASEIEGTWNATKMLFVSKTAPQQSVDLIALGATGVLVLDPSKAFSFTLTPPGGPAEVQTGTWKLSGTVLTVTPTGAAFNWQFNITLTATTLKLAGADVDYDFNDDGTDEPAKLTIEATR
jgi:hypothetical protein